MSIYDQRIVHFSPRRIDAGAQHILSVGAQTVAAKDARLFGVFKSIIGLSTNRAVVICEWPDEASATAFGHLVLEGLDGARTESREIWEPTSRPLPGESPADAGGVYSHRAFDILETDWPRFLELSQTAWGNFEGVHATRVVGFWKSRTAPAPGQLRIRLMAWYRNLDAWERSRFWNPDAKAGSDAAFQRFRERAQMTQDTSVSILLRAPKPGEVGSLPATASS